MRPLAGPRLPVAAAEAAALAAAVGTPFGDGADWVRAATAPDHVALVALDGGRVVGAARGVVAGTTGDVLVVAVAPEARRRGTGRALVEALLAALADRGATSVVLEVAAGNAAARRLYAGLGFEQVHVRSAYYRDGDDALVLRRIVAR